MLCHGSFWAGTPSRRHRPIESSPILYGSLRCLLYVRRSVGAPESFGPPILFPYLLEQTVFDLVLYGPLCDTFLEHSVVPGYRSQ